MSEAARHVGWRRNNIVVFHRWARDCNTPDMYKYRYSRYYLLLRCAPQRGSVKETKKRREPNYRRMYRDLTLTSQGAARIALFEGRYVSFRLTACHLNKLSYLNSGSRAEQFYYLVDGYYLVNQAKSQELGRLVSTYILQNFLPHSYMTPL